MALVCAVIDPATNVVVNMIVANEGDEAPAGTFLVPSPPDFVAIGTMWDGANFVEPPPPIPKWSI